MFIPKGTIYSAKMDTHICTIIYIVGLRMCSPHELRVCTSNMYVINWLWLLLIFVDSKPDMSATKRCREEWYAEDSSSDEEPVQSKKMKPTSVTQKAAKLVSSSESESEKLKLPSQSPANILPQSSGTISVSIRSFFHIETGHCRDTFCSRIGI